MMSEGFVLVHMHIESEKDNLVESRPKSGTQKWPSVTNYDYCTGFM